MHVLLSSYFPWRTTALLLRAPFSPRPDARALPETAGGAVIARSSRASPNTLRQDRRASDPGAGGPLVRRSSIGNARRRRRRCDRRRVPRQALLAGRQHRALETEAPTNDINKALTLLHETMTPLRYFTKLPEHTPRPCRPRGPESGLPSAPPPPRPRHFDMAPHIESPARCPDRVDAPCAPAPPRPARSSLFPPPLTRSRARRP